MKHSVRYRERRRRMRHARKMRDINRRLDAFAAYSKQCWREAVYETLRELPPGDGGAR